MRNVSADPQSVEPRRCSYHVPPKNFYFIAPYFASRSTFTEFFAPLRAWRSKSVPMGTMFSAGVPLAWYARLGRKGPGTGLWPKPGNRRRQEIHVYVKGPGAYAPGPCFRRRLFPEQIGILVVYGADGAAQVLIQAAAGVGYLIRAHLGRPAGPGSVPSARRRNPSFSLWSKSSSLQNRVSFSR